MWFKHKCKICKRKTGILIKIAEYGEYEDMIGLSSYAHLECIQTAIENPELFGTRMVDTALDLLDRFETQKQLNKEKNERRRNRIINANIRLLDEVL